MFVAPCAAERLREAERSDFLENRWPSIEGQIKGLGFQVSDLVERARA